MRRSLIQRLATFPLLIVCSFHAQAQLQFKGSVAFVEGPAWRSDGIVFFTDIPNNKILKRGGNGQIELHRTPSGRANGLLFDAQDRMLIAETDGRVVREDLDGSIEVLAEAYDGMRLNSPNDLTLDTKGRIYFTDPAYGGRQNATQRDADGEIIDGVYRMDTSGKLTRILNTELDIPNGIVVSPGDEYLYVADNNSLVKHGARKLWRFDFDQDGNINASSRKLMFDWGTDRGPDGITIDNEGNIYVTAGFNHPRGHITSLTYKAGIYVISPEAELIHFIPVPMDNVTNVTFGGNDYSTLYITAGHSLWSYQNDIPGYRPFNNK